MSEEPDHVSSESLENEGSQPLDDEGGEGPPVGFGKGVNDYLNNYVRNADAKAGVFVAADLTIGGFLLANQPDIYCASIFNWLAIVLLAVSAFFGGLVVFPRAPSGRTGLIFWEDILSRSGPEQYTEDLKGLNSGRVEEEYATQNYYVSHVLHRKYYWIGWCLWCFFAAVICAAFSVGIS
jgi:hypothetical protein